MSSQVYCECDKYWKGEACDIPYCKANCGSPDHGYCDLTGEKLCVCNDSWQGKLVNVIVLKHSFMYLIIQILLSFVFGLNT